MIKVTLSLTEKVTKKKILFLFFFIIIFIYPLTHRNMKEIKLKKIVKQLS